MKANVYGQASQAYTGGLNNLRQAGQISAGERSGISTIQQYGTHPNANVTAASNILGSEQPYMTEAAGMYSDAATPAAVTNTMNSYLNPYQEQVIDNTLSRMRDNRDEALNMVQANAANAGAFGGARHGLVEAEVINDSNRNMAETAAGMSQDGFNLAAQLSNARINQIQQSAAGLAGLGGQELQRGATLGNLGMGQQQQALAAGQAVAGIQAGAENRRLAAAQGALGGAATGVNIGNSVTQQQAQAGGIAQGLNQQILSQGAGQYDQYVNYPQMALASALAGIQGNPLQAATTTTVNSNPSLLSYLSLGAGLGSSYMRSPMAGGKG